MSTTLVKIIHKLYINLIQNTQFPNAKPVYFSACKVQSLTTGNSNKLSMDMPHNSVNFCCGTRLNKENSLKICLLTEWRQNSTINSSWKISVLSIPNENRCTWIGDARISCILLCYVQIMFPSLWTQVNV